MRSRSKSRGPTRILAVVAVVLGLVGADSAPAAGQEATVTISGGGFGHGTGMSQYGALGHALAGHSATQILQHYYTGVTVDTLAMPSPVRVGILQRQTAITLSGRPLGDGSGKFVLRVAGRKRTIATALPGEQWRIEAVAPEGVLLFRDGVPVVGRNGWPIWGGDKRPIVISYKRFGSIVDVAERGRSYSLGRMEIGSYASDVCPLGRCLRAVVSLPMQKYLYGLGEVPASWPSEALKAQTIASRTYVFKKISALGQHRPVCDCGIYDTPAEQAYIGDERRRGARSYWDEWQAAVDATRGQVILYAGVPINALYSASSGGHTEDNENIWGGAPVPYLRGVDDPYDDTPSNPYHEWQKTMSWADFSSKLDAAFGTGPVLEFEVLDPRGVSGRVTVARSGPSGGVRIVGTLATVHVDGYAVRNALGLKDTLFYVNISPAR